MSERDTHMPPALLAAPDDHAVSRETNGHGGQYGELDEFELEATEPATPSAFDRAEQRLRDGDQRSQPLHRESFPEMRPPRPAALDDDGLIELERKVRALLEQYEGPSPLTTRLLMLMKDAQGLRLDRGEDRFARGDGKLQQLESKIEGIATALQNSHTALSNLIIESNGAQTKEREELETRMTDTAKELEAKIVKRTPGRFAVTSTVVFLALLVLGLGVIGGVVSKQMSSVVGSMKTMTEIAKKQQQLNAE